MVAIEVHCLLYIPMEHTTPASWLCLQLLLSIPPLGQFKSRYSWPSHITSCRSIGLLSCPNPALFKAIAPINNFIFEYLELAINYLNLKNQVACKLQLHFSDSISCCTLSPTLHQSTSQHGPHENCLYLLTWHLHQCNLLKIICKLNGISTVFHQNHNYNVVE